MKFFEAKEEVRKLIGNRYMTLSYTFSEFSSGGTEVECEIYVDGLKFFQAPTWEGALNKLRARLEPPKPIDLTIDLTEAPDEPEKVCSCGQPFDLPGFSHEACLPLDK